MGIGALRYSRQYHADQIKNIKVIPRSTVGGNREDLMPFRFGRISFDYGMRTYRFANGIDEAEAEYIIGLFKTEGFLKSAGIS